MNPNSIRVDGRMVAYIVLPMCRDMQNYGSKSMRNGDY
jgi:hypothetical protein